jgi:hypothetical protein
VAQGGDEAARVDGEEGRGFAVGVDFDVLVGEELVFEGDPDALDEGAGYIYVSLRNDDGGLKRNIGNGEGRTRMQSRRVLGRLLWSETLRL